MDQILDVNLARFESGTQAQRAAVIDGVMRSLKTGFVYVSYDLSSDMLDTAYEMLEQFFSSSDEVKSATVAPGTNGQAGYTGVLTETAASSDSPDWKEMLNWGARLPTGHPLRVGYPTSYNPPVMPEETVPGITNVLFELYDRLLDLQRRFLRIVAAGIGCHETFFDAMVRDGSTLARAIHYPAMTSAPGKAHVWAAEHCDINLITALPRATSAGLQVKVEQSWVDATPPEGAAIINSGIMLEHVTNGVVPAGVHRVVAAEDQCSDRYSVVQFCHPTPCTVLSPVASCITSENNQRFSPIQAGDLLAQVLFDINLVEAARRVQ